MRWMWSMLLLLKLWWKVILKEEYLHFLFQHITSQKTLTGLTRSLIIYGRWLVNMVFHISLTLLTLIWVLTMHVLCAAGLDWTTANFVKEVVVFLVLIHWLVLLVLWLSIYQESDISLLTKKIMWIDLTSLSILLWNHYALSVRCLRDSLRMIYIRILSFICVISRNAMDHIGPIISLLLVSLVWMNHVSTSLGRILHPIQDRLLL